MKNINFGKIDKFIIFGGNIVTIDLCKFLKSKKIDFLLFTTPSQSEEIIFGSNKTFKNHLIENKINHKIVSNIKSHHLIKYVNNHTMGISNSCRWIFNENQIKLFKKRLINIHFSNLPENRGSGGLSWDIMMNKYKSGSTIHLIEKKIDSGFSLLKQTFIFPKKFRNTLYDMQKYSYKVQKNLLLKFTKKVLKNKNFILNPININNDKSTYWPRINSKKNAWINWEWTADEIVSFIKSCSLPHVGAGTFFEKKIVRLKYAQKAKSRIKFHPYQYGIIYKKKNNKLYVACKGGGIIINSENLKKNKKIIGKRLFTTFSTIEKSLENKL